MNCWKMRACDEYVQQCMKYLILSTETCHSWRACFSVRSWSSCLMVFNLSSSSGMVKSLSLGNSTSYSMSTPTSCCTMLSVFISAVVWSVLFAWPGDFIGDEHFIFFLVRHGELLGTDMWWLLFLETRCLFSLNPEGMFLLLLSISLTVGGPALTVLLFTLIPDTSIAWPKISISVDHSAPRLKEGWEQVGCSLYTPTETQTDHWLAVTMDRSILKRVSSFFKPPTMVLSHLYMQIRGKWCVMWLHLHIKRISDSDIFVSLPTGYGKSLLESSETRILDWKPGCIWPNLLKLCQMVEETFPFNLSGCTFLSSHQNQSCEHSKKVKHGSEN